MFFIFYTNINMPHKTNYTKRKRKKRKNISKKKYGGAQDIIDEVDSSIDREISLLNRQGFELGYDIAGLFEEPEPSPEIDDSEEESDLPSNMPSAPPPNYIKSTQHSMIPEMPAELERVRKIPEEGSFRNERCTNNPETSVKMIVGHGSLIPEKFFIIPNHVKIITLSSTNVCIKGPPDIHYVQPLLKYYINGRTIFKDNDNNKEQDPAADEVIDYYRKLGGYGHGSVNLYNFQYGLHLPGEIFNETNVQLSGSGCESKPDGGLNCAVICFQKGTFNYQDFYHYKPKTKELKGIDGKNISESIKLSDMIDEMGGGTYILFTCRYFEGNEEQYNLSKTFSNKQRADNYIIPPTKPLGEHPSSPGIKLHDLESVQPPAADFTKIIRFNVSIDKDKDKKTQPVQIDWLVLRMWLISNEYNFDEIEGESEEESNNRTLLRNIFNEIDYNKDGIINLDDILVNELKRKPRLNDLVFSKLPMVLLRMCGNEKFEIAKDEFIENIIKSVKYSVKYTSDK